MGRGNAASRLQQAVNRRLTLVKRASNPKNRLARLILFNRAGEDGTEHRQKEHIGG